MINIAVLSSTNGTDLQAIIDNKNSLPANLKIVICNKECGALEKAKKYNIKHCLIPSAGKDREKFDFEVNTALKEEEIDYIFLIGYMRILSPWFVQQWKNKILNIHPSLLPSFAGGMDKDVHKEVLEHGCKITGCTLHFVDEGVDTGQIVMQKAVTIDENETPDSLKSKVQQAEQQVIIESIVKLAQGKIRSESKKNEKGIAQKQIAIDVNENHIIHTKRMGDQELEQFLKANAMSLKISEVRLIEEKLGRSPTLTELHIFNIEWSEHCSYKSSKEFLKLLPTHASNVILGPKEDAGIIQLTTVNNESYGLVIAHESHNHPSQVVPFEGAATGVGGIVRDVLCMGAQVVATADPLRFGNPKGENAREVKYIANSVIEGIAGYTNPLGIPNIGGDVYFNDSFDDNCLVNVVCLGIVKEKEVIHSSVPKGDQEFDVIAIGKATDNSGFGGAAFASVILEEESNKGAVQVPDPFLKNVIIRATHEVFKLARKKKIEIGFKDCGAGGIMCATSELGSEGNKGMEIDLEKIHASMKDLPPYIIACAETQERFVMITPKNFTNDVLKVYNNDFDLPNVSKGARASVIGKTTNEKQYVLKYNGEVVCNAPIQEVTTGIVYKRDFRPKPRNFNEPTISEPTDYNALALNILHHPNVASRSKVFKHYDTEVLGNAVLRSGEADAGVIAPIRGEKIGVALSTDCNPLYNRIAPFAGGKLAVYEAMRNVACVGATPQALTDCLCNGNPEDPQAFFDFVQNVKGISDAAKNLFRKGTTEPVPFVSGNVSFYNESRKKSIDPSPIISCVGLLDDYSKAITMQIKKEGSGIYLIGRRKNECGGSVYYQLHNEIGRNLPFLDYTNERNAMYSVIDMISERLVLASHDISDGGLIACISEMILGGDAQGKIGIKLDYNDNLRSDVSLCTETPGFVLEISHSNFARVQEICKKYNVDLIRIGQTVIEPRLTVQHNDKRIIDLSIEQLKKSWTTGFLEAVK